MLQLISLLLTPLEELEAQRKEVHEFIMADQKFLRDIKKVPKSEWEGRHFFHHIRCGRRLPRYLAQKHAIKRQLIRKRTLRLGMWFEERKLAA